MIKIGEAGGLTVEAVMHAQFTVLPATATVAEVRDYFALSSHRRLAVVADDDGVYLGALTRAHLTGGDPAPPPRSPTWDRPCPPARQRRPGATSRC